VELLEVILQSLSCIDEYCKKDGVPLLAEDRLSYLVQRAINLIDEMNEEIALPPNLQHRFRTPEDATVSFNRKIFKAFRGI
jgi:hypothetical protein